MKKQTNLKTWLVIAILFLGCYYTSALGYTIYVKEGASGNGISWANAYGFLQDALDDAETNPSVNQIWVAAGTYYPTYDYELGIGDRGNHFRLINGVAIYGGFPDVGNPDMEERDPNTYETILSGDIGTADVNSDNCYHVFYHPSGTNLDSTAVLDGFIITTAHANGFSSTHKYGGGMYNYGSSPTVTDCNFSDNRADEGGGGMYNYINSDPSVTKCTFSGNGDLEDKGGGGMYNYGSSPTVTDCNFSSNKADNGGGMYNSGSSPTVTDCNFSDNRADEGGGGMYNYINSDPSVTKCTFSGNGDLEDKEGGGMYNYKSSPTVTDCNFSSNKANNGGGMSNYLGSNPTVINCTFNGNEAEWGGGIDNEQSSPTVINCTFRSNSSEYGGGMENNESNPTVTNCTFSGNEAIEGGGMDNYNNSYPNVTNCILWGDLPDEICDFSSTPAVTYSDVQGGYPGEGNIDEDPNFKDVDLRLDYNSPCIDDGNNMAIPPDITDLDGDGDTIELIPWDLDGNPRIFNGVVDMGAFECQQIPIIFVNGNATGGNNGTSWKDAYLYIQDALAYASSHTERYEIWVAAGIYYPDANSANPAGNNEREATFHLINNVAVYGGFAGNEDPCTFNLAERDFIASETILSGDINTQDDNTDNSYHVVTSSEADETTVLDGFTITGGNANGFEQYDVGGGMYNEQSSPTVTNCSVRVNTAVSGGGICNYLNSNPTVTNCTFSGNSAVYRGSGMYNYNSDPTVINCTFTSNTADLDGGGMYNNSSSPTVTNCILWNNSPDEIYNNSSTPTVTHSNVQGGLLGDGNIDSDPCFVDANNPDLDLWNLRLTAGSPCIDTGDNAAVLESEDLDGRYRIVDGDCNDTEIVDMGAYEFLPADIDSSGSVDFVDFRSFALRWMDTACDECGGADLTCDGNVDSNDLREFVANWLD